jgi:arginyl-tRNA synthetase
MKKRDTKLSEQAVKEKMSYREFVERSIKALRTPPYSGIHVVYSHFNTAFRQYYNEEPRPIIEKMIAEGFIVSRVARGGAVIMLASDVDEKAKVDNDTSAALAKILTHND